MESGLILKIFRRLDLKLVLSEGFSKMPKVSYSPALPIFIESECEIVNFQTHEPLKDNFCDEFEKCSPNGIKIVYLKEQDENEPKSLENYIQWAKYEAKINFEKNHVYNLDKIRYIIEKCLSSDELLIKKKTKKGIEKIVNYRNSLKSIRNRSLAQKRPNHWLPTNPQNLMPCNDYLRSLTEMFR